MSVYEARSLVGIPILQRYRCSCGTKFDLLSPVGEVFLYVAAVIIPGTILFAPDKKFAHPDERWSILAVASLLSVALVVVAARSRKNAKANALLP